MKIALVHDYIKEYGGAERVLEALHEIWPDAPVYTTVYLPEFLGPHKQRFKDWKIVTSFFQQIPYVAKLISPLRLFTPWVFENWDFSEFDVVITSATGAYFPNLIVRKPETVHICYCHTPPRYLYGYPTARNWKKNKFGRMIGEFLNVKLRQTDFLSAQRPDYFIANSIEVKNRIRKFYRRDATVIYPPVNIESRIKNHELRMKKKTYYLAGGRLARAKNIHLAIEACNKLKLPLKIFGKSFADYGDELKQIAGPTIEFLGEVNDEERYELYKNAKAFIFPSEYEDFGIMPVEAQGAGTPVIAYQSGGVKETVIEGKTGVFFDELTAGSIVNAIKRLDKMSIKSDDCIRNAEKYSKGRFKNEIVNFINKVRG
jgi:glycosyltransferase involved in cell wall biosynthesis